MRACVCVCVRVLRTCVHNRYNTPSIWSSQAADEINFRPIFIRCFLVFSSPKKVPDRRLATAAFIRPERTHCLSVRMILSSRFFIVTRRPASTIDSNCASGRIRYKICHKATTADARYRRSYYQLCFIIHDTSLYTACWGASARSACSGSSECGPCSEETNFHKTTVELQQHRASLCFRKCGSPPRSNSSTIISALYNGDPPARIHRRSACFDEVRPGEHVLGVRIFFGDAVNTLYSRGRSIPLFVHLSFSQPTLTIHHITPCVVKSAVM